MDTQAPHLYVVEFIVLRCQHSPGFICFHMTHGIAKSIPRDESAANRTARPNARYRNICASTVTDTNAVTGGNTAEVWAFCIKIVSYLMVSFRVFW